MFKTFRILMFPAVILLGACASSDVTIQPVRIEGGHLIGIPFGPHGPLAGQGNGFVVLQAGSAPVAEKGAKELVYQFIVGVPLGTKLQRVVVNDISEEQPSALVDDGKPWVTDNVWRINTAPIAFDDPRLAWVYTVTPSLRVYRFTITDSTGKETVINHVVGYPDPFKRLIRTSWGENMDRPVGPAGSDLAAARLELAADLGHPGL